MNQIKQIVASITISSVGDFFGNIFGTRKPSVSCAQNGGPFPQVDSTNINKSDVQKQLTNFYNLCLKSEFKGGYLPQAENQNSESEAYALTQAYLMGDRLSFARILNFVNANLRRSDDSLLSWKFTVTKKPIWQKPFFQTYKVTIDDSNSATDADTDFAYALLLAGSSWHNQQYTNQAMKMIGDIWNKEVVQVSGKYYTIAGNWANQNNFLAVDPSYISPQAYRSFAKVDTTDNWNQLVTDSYSLLTQVSTHSGQPFLPSDWIQVNKPDGSLSAYPDKPNSQDYTFDAFRTFWRVADDQLKNPSTAAFNYLNSATSFANDWQKNQEMCALYHLQNGNYVCDTSTTSTLAAPIGIFMVTNQSFATQVIQKYYLKGNALQFPDTDFYAKSWHWFAIYLWAHS